MRCNGRAALSRSLLGQPVRQLLVPASSDVRRRGGTFWEMISASCHCGAVQIEVSEMPDTLTQCTCSICRRYGALWAYRTRETARVLSELKAETAYVWNDRVIEFFHCNTCGCMTRYESVEKSPESRIAVNARMMSPRDIAGLKVRTFDGADSWKYMD